MSKPNYRATVTFDPDRKVFSARAPELEHCSGEGATRAEAIAKLEEEIDAQLANMLSHGSTPPRAVDEETFSGEVSAKVSKQLHRDLAYQARSEGIDLDHLVGELLAAAMESRKQHRGVRSGNSRPREDQQPNDNVGNRFDGGGGRAAGPRLRRTRQQRAPARRSRQLHRVRARPRAAGRRARAPRRSRRRRSRRRCRRRRSVAGGAVAAAPVAVGGGGGRGPNPNHGGPNRGMQRRRRSAPAAARRRSATAATAAAATRRQRQPRRARHGNAGAHADQGAAPSQTSAPPPAHDPDSSGNA